MSELFHECGIAAVYHLDDGRVSEIAPFRDPQQCSLLIPRMLLEIQNRGQLAAGMTSYQPGRRQLIDTHKDVGSVTEVFQLNHAEKRDLLMHEYRGPAAIGHVRYATCGKDDRSYAQPFERHHIEKSKWFSFAFNGQLANYRELKEELLSRTDFHLARETDTEVLLHLLCQELSAGAPIDYLKVLRDVGKRLDGAYSMAYLSANGDMFIARDPLGLRPLCYAQRGPLFAAASESIALTNIGFRPDEIRSLEPGCAIIIQNGELRTERFAESPKKAHCFFEWIYFANVASTLDDRSVYLSRKRLGEELAAQEDEILDDDTIVVPVPDTAKAAAASMAYELKVPWLEGLIRNRYAGRTFIESGDRAAKVRAKYTPLPEVLSGKRVFLVEDSIVRSTTMKALISRLREQGGAREVHVRVACPPIIAPCFYGIDMSTVSELFAPRFLAGKQLQREEEKRMADALGADSLRYLPVEAIARSVNLGSDSLCQACITGDYPSPAGKQLYQIALDTASSDSSATDSRIFDMQLTSATRT